MGINCLQALCGKTSRELTKLKTLLGLTVSRLALLRNQRQTRCAQAEADVAHLLLLGHQDRALLRAEMVIKERNMLDVLAMVESYCHLLTERAFLLHNQKECPDELREAAAGLAFAASRCGDLPELREVRRIFSARFGKEFITAAAELRNNCGVSGKMVQKFSTRQPSLEIRAKVTKEIAIEKGIKVQLAEPTPETAENPKPQRKQNQGKTTVEPPSTACDLHELLGGEKLVVMAQEKYKDAGSAAQAAFESAAYAAAAAKTAVELYRSESEGRDSSNPGKHKHISHISHIDNCLPSASCCRSIDLGCRASKVSSLRIDQEKPRGKEILSEIDESDDDEELIRLASKVLVPMNKSHSFAGLRGNDFKTKRQVDSTFTLSSQKRNQDGDEKDDFEEVNEMAIITVEPSKNSKPGRYGSEKRDEAKNVQLSPGGNLAARHSLSRASSFSVRSRR
ncbi:uncharacterized protein LOC110093300 isoform X2 [Dendrobium catenatum]|uniref:uncharacterized protein LOC110093300 isoform X2 n=1 Tax=Dendrobium catenatum TaxID=906689 RepID=UPI0009F60EB7|nr:uncharacterized protein LOC110093300 isoform X2 [Dendrobium catenatum]